MLRIPARTTTLTKKNVTALADIEHLKCLFNARRNSSELSVKDQVQIDRKTYMKIAIDLGKQAGYNQRRLSRLGHEFNRKFAQQMLPVAAELFIQEEISKEGLNLISDQWMQMLGVTEEEYETVLTQNMIEKRREVESFLQTT